MQPAWEELASLPVPYARLSPEGRFLQVNDAICELFGYSREELLTLTAGDLTHPEDRAQSVALVDRAVRHREEMHQVIKRYLHSTGRVIWTLLSTVLLRDENGVPREFLSRVDDITERVRAEPVFLAFVRRFQTIKEQERQGIAIDLHEELGQTLAGLKLELDRLGATLPPEAGATASRLSTVVVDAMNTVRRFTAALRPPILDDLGLESGLEWLLVQFAQRAGIQWDFRRTKTPLSLDWETRIALFRIAQEGVNYVVRSGKAKTLDVSLLMDGDWVVLRLADDGDAPPSDARQDAMEHYIMRERAEVLGGVFRVRPNSPWGTIAEARLPAPLEGPSSSDLQAHWALFLRRDPLPKL